MGAPNGLTTRREIFCPKRSQVCTGEGQYQSREFVAEDFVSQLSTRLVSHPTATKMVTSWGSKLRPKLTTVFKHCSHVFRLDTSDMPTRKNWCSSTAVSMKNVVHEAEKVKSAIRERGSLKVIDKVTVKLGC